MALRANVTAEVDPISRIEGHLGVKVTTDASGYITDAEAHGNLWRGFENFLLGRDINDAITYVQRICGVCPVPHGMTSTYAVDTVLGYSAGHITFKSSADGKGVPEKAVLIRNLVLSAEFLMSSITHFYHLAAPSYVQGPAVPPWTPYFDDTYYHPVLLSSASGRADAQKGIVPTAPGTATAEMQIWDAVILSYVKALKVRRMTFEAGALFAGRMPMTSCYIGGGVTTEGTADLTSRCAKFEELIRAVGLFIINEYVPIAVVLGAIYPAFDNAGNTARSLAPTTSPVGHGAGLGRFLAWGAFPNTDAAGTLTLPGGYYDAAATGDNWTATNKAEVAASFLQATNPTSGAYAGKKTSVPANLLEDISHSRYAVATADNGAYTGKGLTGGNDAAYPGAVTRTKPNRATGYSYMKAPRWNGKACEVGPLARLAVAGLYPVDGRDLAAVVPGYAAVYTNAGALDARVIGADIVTALSNASLVGAVETWIIGLKGGLSTMDRLRARAIESLVLVQAMVGTVSKNAGTGALSFANDGWVHDLMAITGSAALDTAGSTWSNKTIPTGTFQGWGATEAPRGALMHQAKITNGKIVAYQCIVPTTWNGSPKDATNAHGAIEAAMIGAPFSDAGASFDPNDFDSARTSTTITSQGGVEVLRIAQSFDPCIACAVH